MSIRVENQTRYCTADLEALVDFCYTNTPEGRHGSTPEVIHFFEFHPKKPVKSQRIHRYSPSATTYGVDYADVPVKWAKTERNQNGVVWIAAPECWMPKMAQLLAQDETFELPRVAVRLLADSIKGFWHYLNVAADLKLSVKVVPGNLKPVKTVSRQIIRRNRYAAECEGWVLGTTTMRTGVSTMRERISTIRTKAHQAGVRDPLEGLDALEVIEGMAERLNLVEKAILLSLENMRKQEEAT